jgi:hypothetical protein
VLSLPPPLEGVCWKKPDFFPVVLIGSPPPLYVKTEYNVDLFYGKVSCVSTPDFELDAKIVYRTYYKIRFSFLLPFYGRLASKFAKSIDMILIFFSLKKTICVSKTKQVPGRKHLHNKKKIKNYLFTLTFL